MKIIGLVMSLALLLIAPSVASAAYTNQLFSDGFESGNVSSWDSAQGTVLAGVTSTSPYDGSDSLDLPANPGTVTTTSAALSTSGAISSLPVNSIASGLYGINKGSSLTITSGTNTQTWVTSQNYNAGDASISAGDVNGNAQTPNFAYPAGSTITVSPSYSVLQKTLADPAEYLQSTFEIKPTATSGNVHIAGVRGTNGDTKWDLYYIASSQSLEFDAFKNGTCSSCQLYTSTTSVPVNSWTQIQVQYNGVSSGGGASLAINGTTSVSTTTGDYSDAGVTQSKFQLYNDAATSRTLFDDVTLSTYPAYAPRVPTSLAGHGQNGAVGLHWTAPTYDGGSPITYYTVTQWRRDVVNGPWILNNTWALGTNTAPNRATSAYLTGITNGNGYMYKVAANTAAATSGTASSNPISSGTSGVSSLKVSGNHFVNTAGTTIHLHGVDRSGSEYACQQGWGYNDGPMDQASITAMQGWKINIVRVGINESCWAGSNGVPSAYTGTNGLDYQAAIVNYVNLLHENGIYAEIVPMWAGPGNTVASSQIIAPDQDNMPAVWTSIAKVFKSDPLVILGTFGEPDVSYPCIMSGCSNEATWGTNIDSNPTCWSGTHYCYTAAGMSTGLADYRAAGYNGPVAIPCAGFAEACANSDGSNYAARPDNTGASTWWNSVPSDSITPGQIVAEAHIYGGNTLCGNYSGGLASCLDNSVKPILTATSPHPVILGETGQDVTSADCTGTGNISAIVGWADTNGVGVMPWTWTNVSGGACPSLISNYNGTATSGYGQWVHDHYIATW